MSDLLAGATTEYLGLDDYVSDFYRASAELDRPIWKSERAQVFREPGNPSWEAFVEGRWADAVELAGAGFTELETYFTELDGRGCPFHRVRVVEIPPTPYLRWALHVVRNRARAGERVRVITSQSIAQIESGLGRLPELVLLGSKAGYVVDYSEDGTARGAYRFTDGAAIERCTRVLSDLYVQGEDIEQFFHREIASSEPPADRLRWNA